MEAFLQLLGGLRWLALAPLALVVLALLGAGLGERSLRKTLRDLARTACPHCGQPFGDAAAHAARAGWEQAFARMRAENPGVRFRVVARWPVGCPHCERQFSFQPSDGQLSTVA